MSQIYFEHPEYPPTCHTQQRPFEEETEDTWRPNARYKEFGQRHALMENFRFSFFLFISVECIVGGMRQGFFTISWCQMTMGHYRNRKSGQIISLLVSSGE
jgi:hypothetical protein